MVTAEGPHKYKHTILVVPKKNPLNSFRPGHTANISVWLAPFHNYCQRSIIVKKR